MKLLSYLFCSFFVINQLTVRYFLTKIPKNSLTYFIEKYLIIFFRPASLFLTIAKRRRGVNTPQPPAPLTTPLSIFIYKYVSFKKNSHCPNPHRLPVPSLNMFIVYHSSFLRITKEEKQIQMVTPVFIKHYQ